MRAPSPFFGASPFACSEDAAASRAASPPGAAGERLAGVEALFRLTSEGVAGSGDDAGRQSFDSDGETLILFASILCANIFTSLVCGTGVRDDEGDASVRDDHEGDVASVRDDAGDVASGMRSCTGFDGVSGGEGGREAGSRSCLAAKFCSAAPCAARARRRRSASTALCCGESSVEPPWPRMRER